jgi:hypothetical protein
VTRPSERQGPAADDHGPSVGSEDQNDDEDSDPFLEVDSEGAAIRQGNVNDDDHDGQSVESTEA